MIVYPAIDIKDGKCVRLVQGRAEDETIYSNNPVEVALQWEFQGAGFLHVVDLDGAFQGKSGNDIIIREMAEAVSIPIQLGGGIRTMDNIAYLLDEVGASRVILGTAAIETPSLLEQATNKFGTKIAVGIDARDGKVAVRGWVEEKNISPIELGKRVKSMGVNTVIYTDILRDGMLTGPNISSTKDIIEHTGLNIIASGGVSHLNHVRDIKAIGATGVIIGKALYAQKIRLKDALKLVEEY